jgi:DNA-binding NtrC family response regulator
LHRLSLYDWPGNVRELENVIQRAVLLCAGAVIQSAEIDLPVAEEPASQPHSFKQLRARVVADFERNYLVTTLDRYKGNIAQAARASQKNRRVFFQLMHKHHIRVERGLTTAAGEPVVKVVVGVDRNVHPKIPA